MPLEICKSDDVFVVEIPGRSIDASNAGDFKTAVAALLPDAPKLVFDLHNLNFIDSTGLGALVACLRKVQASQGDIRLCGLTKPVRALFELVRMHRVFEIFNNVDEAIQSYRA